MASESKKIKSAIKVIKEDLDWLSQVIEFRFNNYFQESEHKSIDEVPPPDLSQDDSVYSAVIKEYEFTAEERIILLMALAVHVSPAIYDIFFTKNTNFDRGFTVFGGITGQAHSGFIPTGETVSFILSGNDLEKRFELLDLFSDTHFFHTQNILSLTGINENEPVFSGALTISKEYLSLLVQGREYKPQYTSSFPARRLTSRLHWEDAVYDDHTLNDLEEAKIWIQHSHEIMQNDKLQKHLKRGFRILFHGPPGTGKTMTAALLGQQAEMDVYQIDLSAVVSKYIGETEKNLAGIFEMAENKNWILFFDEADALFGKRTSVQSSNDQFVNQQVAYLLQRIEDFDGVVILATNFKDNIDTAFLRRFQSVVYFPKPKLEERLRLWQKYFDDTFDLVDVDLEQIAMDHEITGGSMINVLRHCTIAAKKRGDDKVYMEDILKGINKEYHKEGITL
ncbi:ATP-binding protein [Fulvivirga maritima]|uniref:ATP-binding protein n=1 Tax=Fulvivirga maritima TaxID=2904247 RepID=UPI001F2BB1E5|nr:ATP-binding protein [Fulvivirga maritima]UII27395.1 ATP-binding protein [Fulvivirga maritima]